MNPYHPELDFKIAVERQQQLIAEARSSTSIEQFARLLRRLLVR